MAELGLGPRAKEPTAKEIQERRDQMFQLDQSIRSTLAEGRAAIWKLAAFLDLWDEQNGWTALGCENLHDWLGDPEIAMTKGRFYDLVGTYRELIQREFKPGQMIDLEYTKVRDVLPAVRQGRAKFEDAIDDAKQLSRSDLREKYRDPASGQPDKTTLPPDSEPIPAAGVYKCPHCGLQVDTSDAELIG